MGKEVASFPRVFQAINWINESDAFVIEAGDDNSVNVQT